MSQGGGRTTEPSYLGWLIVALSAVSTAAYFVMSLGVRGQVTFLIASAIKVLARLGLHA